MDDVISALQAGFKTGLRNLLGDDFGLKLGVFLGGLLVLVGLLALVARWWGRIYREEEGEPTSLVRRVLKNSLTPTVARLINRVVDFAFAVVVLHYLTETENGYYGFAALVVGAYLTTVTSFGLEILTTREVGRDPTAANRYLWNTTLIRWMLSTLSVPAVAAVIFFFGLTDQPLAAETRTALWLLSGSLFPAGLAAAVSSLFQARERMEVPAFANLLINVLKVFAGVWALAAGWGVVGLAASALVVTTINALLFLYLQVRLLFPPRPEPDVGLWPWMLREAFPLMLNSLLMLVFFRFDYFILQLYKGPAAVGLYDAAYKLPNATTEIPFYVMMALLPILSRYALGDRERLTRTYQAAMKLLLLLAFPLAMVISVLSPQVILLLGGDKYLPDSAIALSILIWFLPLSYVNGVAQYVLISLNRQRTITVAFALAAIFNVVANFWGIPRYSYIAASAITILTEVVLLVPVWVIVRRELGRLPVFELAWRPALATAVMGIPLVGLRPVGYGVPGLLLGLVLYGGLLLLLRTFTPEERELFRRLLPGVGGRGEGGARRRGDKEKG